MIRVGLTGSIGMGKSTTAQMFRDEGIAVLDSDAVVHEVYRGPATQEIERAFPGVVENGAVNRAKLSAHVVGDAQAMKKLEAIVHPYVWAAREHFLQERKKAGDAIVVYDIPLLFETGADRGVEAIVVVTATADVQRARVLERPGMTQEKFDAILAKQLPDSEKRARADFLVHTDQGLDAARAEVRHILENIKQWDECAHAPSKLGAMQKMREADPLGAVETVESGAFIVRWFGQGLRWLIHLFD